MGAIFDPHLFEGFLDRSSHPGGLRGVGNPDDFSVLSQGAADVDTGVFFMMAEVSSKGAFRAVEFELEFVVPVGTASGPPAGEIDELSLLSIVVEIMVQVSEPESEFVRIRPG